MQRFRTFSPLNLHTQEFCHMFPRADLGVVRSPLAELTEVELRPEAVHTVQVRRRHEQHERREDSRRQPMPFLQEEPKKPN